MISIVIATYGENLWRTLAEVRALPSALRQGKLEIIVEHQQGGTLASTRNVAARKADSEYLLFLDADDELGYGYVDAMMEAIREAEIYSNILFVPRVQYALGAYLEAPKFWPEINLRYGNWLVIGTLVPRELFLQVGGFYEEPIYEDWSLFARCWKAGAGIIKVPDAIYIAHKRKLSRNRSLKPRERIEAHYEIGRQLFPEDYGEAWLVQHLRNVGAR